MASFEDVLGSDNRLAKRLASTSWPDSRAKADRLLPLVTAANTDLVRDGMRRYPGGGGTWETPWRTPW